MPSPRPDIRAITASHPAAFAERPGTISHRSDTPWENIVDLHRQTVDQGTVQRLIDQDVTGDTQCEFAVGIYRIEPNELHPLHLHTSAAEFYFVVAGRARFTLGDEVIEGTPGTALYMPIGMPHAIQTDDSFVEVLYGFTPADITKLGTTFI
jgi:quercetin dioxygenase-like cupin family protein